MHPDLLAITPSFHETAGGAAVYYRTLARHLRDLGWRVELVGDSGAEPAGNEYHQVFPRRCDLRGRGFQSKLRYLAQNLTYLRLPGLVAQRSPKVVLVHSSFLNLPGIFPSVLRVVQSRAKRVNARVVLDVRDQLMPIRSIRHLGRLDGIIACSESIAERLERHGVPRNRIKRIPVIQEPLSAAQARVRGTLRRYGLADEAYILSIGLVKEEKGIDTLLDAYHRHVRPVMPELELVVCGQIKTSRPEILRGLQGPGVRYLGPVTHRDAIHLASAAKLNVCVSRSEGFPRASLESLSLRRPTLLPRGVPEFTANCPGFVARSHEPADVGSQIVELISSKRVPSYPIEQHAPEKVVAQYVEALAP